MVILPVDAPLPPDVPAVERLVADVRAQADAFVFLAGGASKMSDESRASLLALLNALAIVARTQRLAVGDGGTDAGLMQAAGRVRRASGDAFLLIGVAPAPDVTASGEADKVAVEPNHGTVVTVRNPGWVAKQPMTWTPAEGHWGSETDTMYELFARFAQGRPSVTLVANGGGITLDEVRWNMQQGRRLVVVAGSGRAADVLVALLRGETPTGDDALVEKARALDVGRRKELFEVFEMSRGPDALADVLRAALRAKP